MTRMTENEVKLLKQATEIVNAQLEKIEKPIFKGIDWSATAFKALDDVKIKPQGLWVDELTDKDFDYPAFLYDYKKEIYKNYEHYFNGDWSKEEFETQQHNLTSKQIFLEAYNLIKDERNWCQYALKKETQQKYRKIKPLSYSLEESSMLEFEDEYRPHMQYCSIGAILKADGSKFNSRGNHMSSAATFVYRAFEKYIGRGQIDKFNDQHPHAEVIKLWETVGKGEGWL